MAALFQRWCRRLGSFVKRPIDDATAGRRSSRSPCWQRRTGPLERETRLQDSEHHAFRWKRFISAVPGPRRKGWKVLWIPQFGVVLGTKDAHLAAAGRRCCSDVAATAYLPRSSIDALLVTPHDYRGQCRGVAWNSWERPTRHPEQPWYRQRCRAGSCAVAQGDFGRNIAIYLRSKPCTGAGANFDWGGKLP